MASSYGHGIGLGDDGFLTVEPGTVCPVDARVAERAARSAERASELPAVRRIHDPFLTADPGARRPDRSISRLAA